MADFFGTSSSDRLVGTAGNDVFFAIGNDSDVSDRLIGKKGSDTYFLTAGTYNTFYIDDRGTDGAIDTLSIPRGFFNTFSTGAISTFATATRSGNALVLNMPGERSWWRHDSTPDIQVRIVGQYAGKGIETLLTSDGAYNIISGNVGTLTADLIVGGSTANVFSALDGNDYVYGNGGSDTLSLGDGNDVGFGGNGRDTVDGGTGDDRVFGGAGNDRIYGDSGRDLLSGDDGNDKLWGGANEDGLNGGDGRDQLRGGNGNDVLNGGNGDDVLIGQKGADTYSFGTDGMSGDSDVIRERGDSGTWLSHDVIDIRGINPSNVGNGQAQLTAFETLSFAKSGTDAVISMSENANTITIDNMLNAASHNRDFVEELNLTDSVFTFRFVDAQVTNVANDRDWGAGYGSEINEIIFATDADDEIFGGTGINFIVTGAGADTLVYKVGDGAGLGGLGGGVSHDIIQDFDLAQDTLDFTEITGELGTGGYYLQYGEDAQGDATIFIDTGGYEVADVLIELRDISLADLTAADVFAF